MQAALRSTVSLDVWFPSPNGTAAQAAVAMLVTAARAAQARQELEQNRGRGLAEPGLAAQAGQEPGQGRGRSLAESGEASRAMHPMWAGLDINLDLTWRLSQAQAQLLSTQVHLWRSQIRSSWLCSVVSNEQCRCRWCCACAGCTQQLWAQGTAFAAQLQLLSQARHS